MTFKQHKTRQKLFVIRIYPSLSKIEKVLSSVTEKNNTALQLSVLGKLTANKTSSKKESKKTLAHIKHRLSAVLGKQFQFGYFHNPEIGSLFIAGHLTPIFLNKVDERELASLPAGLLGIFKGLGVLKEDANKHLFDLESCKFCLILRGESSVLAAIEPLLS